jgi:chromosome segregation ATPase
MAPAPNVGYGGDQQDNRLGGMATAFGTERQEGLQIDPRYEAAYQTSLEAEISLKEESGDPSRIELLEAEVEELESLLDSEKAKNQTLRDELDQLFQEKERLTAASQNDLNEVRSEIDVCKSSLDIATRELQEKEDAMAEVEEELLLSKQQISQLQEDRLEQQELWSYQLREAERQTQAAAAQFVEQVNGQIDGR